VAQGFNAAWDAHVLELRKYLREVLKGRPSTINPFYVQQRLDWAAEDIISLWNSHLISAPDQVTFNLKREGSNEDRSRAAFFQLMTHFFQKHCALKLPEEVAVLTEVAIPGKEIHGDDVTNALKQRRSKRPPSA
jgi:hypothetical protein